MNKIGTVKVTKNTPSLPYCSVFDGKGERVAGCGFCDSNAAIGRDCYMKEQMRNGYVLIS